MAQCQRRFLGNSVMACYKNRTIGPLDLEDPYDPLVLKMKRPLTSESHLKAVKLEVAYCKLPLFHHMNFLLVQTNARNHAYSLYYLELLF